MNPGLSILSGRGEFAMTPSGLANWGARLASWDGTFTAAKAEANWLGDAFPQSYMASGILVCEVTGPLGLKPSFVEKNFGMQGYGQIGEYIDQAMEEKPKGVLFYVSSPGGGVTGNGEISERVAELSARMPVGVFSDDVNASAAYSISAPAGLVMVSASCLIGSIGSVLQILDATELLNSIGLKYHTFASGKYKAAGNPATPLTEDHSQYFSGLVTKSADAFKNFVARFRSIDAEHQEGQVMRGTDGVAAGFADEIQPSLNAAIARMAADGVPLKTGRRNSVSFSRSMPKAKGVQASFDFKPIASRPGQTIVHTAASLAKAIGATVDQVEDLICSGTLPHLKTDGTTFLFEIAAINKLSTRK